MSTTRFEEGLRFVLKWEGSTFTNDPADHGGATRFGIIQREYDSYRRRRGLPTRSVEFISMQEVREIYQREYWEAVQGDRLLVPLDVITFDTAVLMGVGRAIRFLQQSLNVGVDGIIGSETLGALATADLPATAADFFAIRERHLRAIVERDPSQQRFLKGWLNRLNDLRRAVAERGPLNLAEDETNQQTLVPDEAAATGRALMDLSSEFENEAEEERKPGTYILETVRAATFLEMSGELLKLNGSPLYTLDISYPRRDVLRATTRGNGSGWFDIPAAAVEFITPLGFPSGDPTKVTASIVFRPEFQSLANTFRVLGDVAGRSATEGNLPLDESYCATHTKAAKAFFRLHDTAFDGTRVDDDPANPTPGDLAETAAEDLAAGIARANFGAEQETSIGFEVGTRGEEPARLLRARTLPIDIEAAFGFLDSCMHSSPRVEYGLGAKIHPHGAVPGRGFTRVDCSGFVREAIWRATSPHFNFPDGSVVQRDWVVDQGFQRSSPDEALLHDGVIRIAFLRPQEAPPPRHIGHVALVYNARTLESHGGFGPNSRSWTKTGWQAKAFVYVLNN